MIVCGKKEYELAFSNDDGTKIDYAYSQFWSIHDIDWCIIQTKKNST